VRRRSENPRVRLARAPAVALLVVLALAAAGERDVARAEHVNTHDWMRSLYVVSDLSTHPPATPIVLLLGGSAGRECTVSDRNWQDQIVRRGGSPVVVRNLSSKNQTFTQDLALVTQLPRAPTVVFIGINVGRFNMPPTITFPTRAGPYQWVGQHRYSEERVLSPERKERVAAEWMDRRYPAFAQRFQYNLAVFEQVVLACLQRGLHPVLLDLPRNTAMIGDRLDVPVGIYSRACQGLAASYGIPFVSFVTRAGLESADFFDIAHLVEPGRAKWQLLLSDTSIDLLRQYGMTVSAGDPPLANGELHDWCVSPRTCTPVFVPQRTEPATLVAATDR
jgi:hypothetical protein